MEKLKEWASNMDSPAKRDVVFVYIWTFAKIMSELACEDKGDKILMEGEITARLMEGLDRGKYKGGVSSLMGWMFLATKSIIRDVGFELHRTRIATVQLEPQVVDAWARATNPRMDDVVAAAELREYLTDFDDERVNRLMYMLYVQDMPIVAASSVLGIPPTTASGWHQGALRILEEKINAN